MCRSKGKTEEMYSVLPIRRQCPATLWEAGPQHAKRLLGKTNAVITNAPPFSFLLAFIAEHDVVRHRISTWSFGVSCPGCVPSQPLAPPSLPALEQGVLGRQPWCGTNTLPATMRVAVGKGILIPARLSTLRYTGLPCHLICICMVN